MTFTIASHEINFGYLLFNAIPWTLLMMAGGVLVFFWASRGAIMIAKLTGHAGVPLVIVLVAGIGCVSYPASVAQTEFAASIRDVSQHDCNWIVSKTIFVGPGYPVYPDEARYTNYRACWDEYRMNQARERHDRELQVDECAQKYISRLSEPVFDHIKMQYKVKCWRDLYNQ